MTPAATYPLVLTGSGVNLREWRDDDAPLLVGLFDDPEIRRWTPMPNPFDLPAAEAYLERARQARLGGHRVQLAITADGAAPLGEVLLFGIDHERSEAELGYVVGAAFRGQGLAGAALTLLMGYAHGTLDIARLLLRIDPGNAASCAVARRCGFRLTTEPPVPQQVPGGRANLRTWELLPRE
jgi:RimJ/RimL family protein N-acetyltransferase